MKKNQQDSILDLLNSPAAVSLGVRSGKDRPIEPLAELKFSQANDLPVLPDEVQADEKQLRAYWRSLRAFLRSGEGGNEEGIICAESNLGESEFRAMHVQARLKKGKIEVADSYKKHLEQKLSLKDTNSVYFMPYYP